MYSSSGRMILDSILEKDQLPKLYSGMRGEMELSHQRAIRFLHNTCNEVDSRFDEVMDGPFWNSGTNYRFTRLLEAHQLLASLEQFLDENFGILTPERHTSSAQSNIGADLFKFLRIVLMDCQSGWGHWDLVVPGSSSLEENQTFLAFFFAKHQGTLKIRFWEPNKKKTVCLNLQFPGHYDQTILLKDILTEEEGIKFFFIYMRKIMVKQMKMINDRVGDFGL